MSKPIIKYLLAVPQRSIKFQPQTIIESLYEKSNRKTERLERKKNYSWNYLLSYSACPSISKSDFLFLLFTSCSSVSKAVNRIYPSRRSGDTANTI
mmetsp:Transcript_13908/g.13714  ORF Transcript_13908/g.13714 Transcript_13908/m.13714 type:complete len:96 (+) Transcript_13908:405-692(+)